MILRPLMLLAAAVATSNGSTAVTEAFDPVANPQAVVRAGNARFTVLTPAMIRLEWSATGAFEDRASLVFVNRRLPVPEFSVERDAGRLTVKTEALRLRYTEDDQPFHEDNLSIELALNGRPILWRPGLEDKGNLRGTYRTLDTISGGVPLPPGLLYSAVRQMSPLYLLRFSSPIAVFQLERPCPPRVQ